MAEKSKAPAKIPAKDVCSMVKEQLDALVKAGFAVHHPGGLHVRLLSGELFATTGEAIARVN